MPERTSPGARLAAVPVVVAATLLCAALTPTAGAALDAPANDDFAMPVELTGRHGSWTGTTDQATAEVGEPVHGGRGAGTSVWLTWTAPADGTVSFTAEGRAGPVVTAAYTGKSVDALQPVASSVRSDAGGPPTRFTVVAGTTYHVAVDALDDPSGPATGPMSIDLTLFSPRGDAFDEARVLAGGSDAASTTTFAASREPGEPVHAPAAPDGGSVWFRWTAPAAGTAVLSTAGTRAGPPATAVYLGDRVDVLTAVVRHSCGSVLCFRADAGTTYRIALAPAGADGTGAPVEDDLVLHLRLVTPGNDDVATAASLPGTSGQRSLAVRGSAEPGEPAHAEAPAVASRWYRWAPDVDGIAAIDVDGAARVAAYDASFGDGGVDDLRVLDEAAGSAAAPAGLRFPVVAGDPVLVAVDRWPDGPHAGDGRVTVHYRVGAPRNDRPDAALGLVAPGSAYGTTLGVTAGGEPALPGADSGAVWFRLPATSAAPTVVQTTGSDFGTVLGVYQATGAGLRLVAADDAGRVVPAC